MKRFSTIWAFFCLISTTYLYAGSGAKCDDAIEIKDGYTASATAGQSTWYTAWTYDLPLTVTFTPDGESTQEPTITADFTCTKGFYDNEKLQKYFGKGSSVQMPYLLKCKKNTENGITTYVLSMDKNLRDLMSSQLGITENIQVFVHATFPEGGHMQITPDTEYAECMELGNWVDKGVAFPINAHDDVTTYNLPVGKWSNDSIRMIWTGSGTNTIYLGINQCQFSHESTNENFYKQYTFHAGNDTIKIPHSEITAMLKNGLQTGGVYYMHTDATSNGTMLFEHQPEPQASGNAKILQMDETVSADSSILYCFSTKWTESMQFQTAAVNLFRMVVSKKPFEKDQIAGNTDIIATYQFDKVEDGHIVKLNSTQMQALIKQVASGEKYLYVRFYCIDPRAKVTPTLWSTSDCEEKAPILESGETIQLNSTNRTKNYRFNANEWCKGDIEIYWKSSSQIQIFVFDSCGQTSTNKQNPHYIWSAIKPATKNGATYKLASTEDMKSWQWIEKATDNGNLYMMLYSDKGDVKVTLQREEEKEVEIPAAPLDSTFITTENATETNLFTGVAAGYTLAGTFTGSNLRPIQLTNCFGSDNMPQFDELYIFTTTTTATATKTITVPNGKEGSNAITPCYIYTREDNGYKLVRVVDNINTSDPITSSLSLSSAATEHKSIYISGFAPYASCGFTKDDEGVFHLRGGAGDTWDIYMEEAYIYSRQKTANGCPSTASTGNTYSEDYARGSGAVLSIECTSMRNANAPMQATIHIRGNNQLTSVNGCYYNMVGGQINHACAPVEIHLSNRNAAENTPSYTVLNLTDEWNGTRTRGFLSLQKQANNAPSIDLGNPYTVFNLLGGQLQLQNAIIATNNYKNTMAISYRDGMVGGIFMSYGIGADNAGGTVNLYDGTTTVIPMTVPEEHRQYYLMDADGETTSCLRTPLNTHIYGGSHCWMRACANVESRGGSPKGYNDVTVGQIVYTTENLGEFDANSDCIGGQYGTESMTADNAGKYYLWIPQTCDPRIKPEQDQPMRYWLAAMTEIEATSGSFGGKVGGPIEIGNNVVSNLLYCQIDENISQVISAQDAYGNYTYEAPVKNPAGSDYLRVTPSYVGTELNNEVTDEEDYTIQDHIYYVCPAKADEWLSFAAPFDIQRVWVMETYSEAVLAALGANGTPEDYFYQSEREVAMIEQAKHNADFAGFMAVVMALGSNTPFDKIVNDYLTWAKTEDKKTGLWSGNGEYTLRKRKALIPMVEGEHTTDNFYILENVGLWYLSDDSTALTPKWQVPASAKTYNPTSPTTLMQKGHVYSLLFPYSYGTERMETKDDDEREYWDYWSGKLLIFEGKGPQTIRGKQSQRDQQKWFSVDAGEGMLSGNFTLSDLTTMVDMKNDVYQYISEPANEQFYRTDASTPINEYNRIPATQAFLVADIRDSEQMGVAQSVRLHDGVVTYWKEPTGSQTTHSTQTQNIHKALINGRIYIIRDGKTFDLVGNCVKN